MLTEPGVNVTERASNPERALSVIVQFDIDVLSRFERQSEKTVPYLEPVTCGQHQLLGIRKLCSGVLFLGFSIVAEYSGGCADGSESVVAEDVMAEMMVRFQRESLETGNVLSYSDGDTDVHHGSELIQEP